MTLFQVILLSVLLCALALVVYTNSRSDSFKIMSPRIPSLTYNKPNLVKDSYSKCLCFSGGGLRSFYGHHGAFISFLNEYRKNQNNFRLQVNDILKKFNTISSISGGAWYISMLCYDDIFNRQNNNFTQFLSSNVVSNKLWFEYILQILNHTGRIRNLETSLDVLDIPYYISFFISVYQMLYVGSLDVLVPFQDFVDSYVFLNRLNAKVNQPNINLKNIDFVFGTGIVTDSNISINTSDPVVSYVIQPKGCAQPIFPCNPGPLIANNNLKIHESNGNAFNRLNYNFRTTLPPNPNFDNTTFNTCNFNLYSRPGIFSDTLTDTNIYRCQNVGVAECCRVNSKINQCGNIIPGFISNNNKLKFMIKNSLTGKIQYVAYNYLTEKEPTGEYSLTNNRINSQSRRMYLNDQFDIDDINMQYNTGEEYVNKAACVSSSFASFISPCFIKNALYAGFSDQELLINTVFSSLNVNNTSLFSLKNKDKKIIKNTCEIPNLCNSDFDKSSKLPWSSILSKLNDNLVVRSTDGGNLDGTGLLSAIKNHQSKYGNVGKMDAIVFTTTNFDLSAEPTNDIDDPRVSNYSCFVRSLFKNYVCIENRPGVYDNNTKDLIYTLPKKIKDIINEISEFNFIEELGVVLGGIALLALINAVISILSPIIGYTVSLTLIPFISGYIYEALNLDTDFHLTVDNEGKVFDSYNVLFTSPKILDADFDKPFKRSPMIKKNNNKVQMNLIHYKNVELLNSDFFEIKKGIIIENLYFIQSFYDLEYSRVPSEITIDGIRPYKNQTGYAFDAFKDCLQTDRRFQSMFDLL